MGQPKYAVNPSDGKVMRNDGSGWKPVKSAKNDQGEILINEGSGWVPVPSKTGARPKMSIGKAMMTMGPQGRDWAMTDEAAGAKRLGGIPGWLDKTVEMSPMAAPINMNMGAIGLAMEAFGKPPEPYTEGRDAVRADVRQAREDRPVTAFASEVVGGGAYPMGGLKAGAPIIKESLKMAFLGLLQGGTYAYNASEGDTADRIESGKAGATVGGLIGALIPGGSAAATPLLRSGKGTLAKGADMVGRVFGKDLGAEAGHAEQVARAAVQRSMERSKMTPEKVLEAIDKFGDKPAVLAEVIGQDAVNALTALTRAPGATAQKAQDIIADRFGGFPARAADDLRTATGLTDKQIAGDFTEEIATRRKEAAPAYSQLFQQDGSVASARLEQLSKTNTLGPKIAQAKKDAVDLAVAKGRDPKSVTPLEVFDLAKQSLDDDVANAFKLGDNTKGNRLETLRTALLKELDDLTENRYAATRDLGGEAPRLQQAFDQGTKALRPSTQRNTVIQQTNALNPQDRPAYAAGTANVIDEELARSIPPNKYRLPATQQKVTAAFGDEGGNAFIKNMSAEAELRDLGSRWGPRMSSVTGVVGEHGSNSGADVGLRAAFALAKGNLKELALIASGVMRRRGFSEAERNAMGDLLLSNPQEGLKRLGIQLPTPSAPAAPVASSIAPPQQSPQPANALAPQQPMKSSGTATFGNDLANAAVGGTVGGMGGSFSGEFIDYNKDGKIDDTDKQIGFLIGTGVGAFGAPAGTRIGVKGQRFDMKGSGPKSVKEAMRAELPGSPEYQRAVAKGLDMSQPARMQRARDMGFDTGTVLYHGTNADIQAFDRGRGAWNEKDFGIHLGTKEQAQDRMRTSVMEQRRYGRDFVENSNVMPVYVRGKKFLRLQDDESWSPQQMATQLAWLDDPINVKFVDRFNPTSAEVRQAIEAAGYDGIVYKNKFEGAKSGAPEQDSYIIFDPSNIRSVNAAFDPDMAASPMLTAGPSGKPPKLMPDVPKGTRKPGQKPNISGTIQRGQEQSSSVPIAKAVGGEGLAFQTAKREAEDMMARNVSLEEIQSRTGLVPISYKGQTVWRAVNGDITPYEANMLFYEALRLPRGERADWVQGILEEVGPKIEPLQLGGQRTPMVKPGKNALSGK